MGMRNHSRALFCMTENALHAKQGRHMGKATLAAEWLRTTCLFNRMLFLKETPPSSHLSPPPPVTATTCYPHLSARLEKGQLHLSLSATLYTSWLFSPPKSWVWNKIKRICVTVYSPDHLPSSSCLLSTSLCPPFPPLMPAHCSYFWCHHLISLTSDRNPQRLIKKKHHREPDLEL